MKKIKEFFERGKQGYTNCDKWNTAWFFADIMSKTLYDIEPKIMGYPTDIDIQDIRKMPVKWIAETAAQIDKEVDSENFSEDFRNWKLILLRVAYCLKIQNELLDGTDDYPELFNSYSDLWHHQLSDGGKNFTDLCEPSEENPSLNVVKFGEIEPELDKKFWKREEEIFNYRSACKDEAFDLMKKYFYALWD